MTKIFLFLLNTMILLNAKVNIDTSDLFNLSVSTLGEKDENLLLFSKIKILDTNSSSATGFMTDLHMVACKVHVGLATDLISAVNKSSVKDLKEIQDIVTKIAFKDCFQQTNSEFSRLAVIGDGDLSTRTIEEALFKNVYSQNTLNFQLFFKTLSLNASNKKLTIHSDHLKNQKWNNPIPYTMDITRSAEGPDFSLKFSNLSIDTNLVLLNRIKSVELISNTPTSDGSVRLYELLQDKLATGLDGVFATVFGNKNDHFRSDALFSLTRILNDNYDDTKKLISSETVNKLAIGKSKVKIFDDKKQFKFFLNIIDSKAKKVVDFKRTLKIEEEPIKPAVPDDNPINDPVNEPTSETKTTPVETKTTATTKTITTSHKRTWIVVSIILLLLALMGIIIMTSVIYRRRLAGNKTVSVRRRKVEL